MPRSLKSHASKPYLALSLIVLGAASLGAPACSSDKTGGGGTGVDPLAPGAGGSLGGSSGLAGSGGSGADPVGTSGASSVSEGMGGMIDLGNSGAGGGGSTPTGPVTSEDFVSDVEISVHDRVNTILVVEWTQAQAADQVWLEFTFEAGNVMTSPPRPGALGAHSEKVLGVPGETDVTIRIVSDAGGVKYVTGDRTGRTEAVPAVMPRPQVSMFDAKRASEDRWLFGSVENTPPAPGGNRPAYYNGQFWLYIIDRQGRIVWYHNDPANNASSSYQRMARDGGQYIFVDQGRRGNTGVLKMTLDYEYFETIDVPVGDAIDVTDDGSILYDVNGTLHEYTAAGQDRTIWSCTAELDLEPNCYSNVVNWNAADDTVLLSFPEPGAVVEIDRATGDLVGYYGNQPDAWDFAPPLTTPPAAWRFGVQHFANITASGTLMVSSHLPPYETFTPEPHPGSHAFIEFEVDRATQTLRELWRYSDGQEWAHAKGMALKLESGNVLANYGTGGVIREITPDKQTVFYVKFDLPSGNDAYNMMVGHNELINDLYALNGGPQ